jgi:hypothetical protein
MTVQLAGAYVKIDDSSNQSPKETSVYQYIDVLQSDITSTANRKNYEVFVTGAADRANVTSTLYQTIYDQDFTLSTSNPLFDLTFGLYKSDVTNDNNEIFPRVNGKDYSYDAEGKIVGFSDDELMIREKVNIYRQFAQNLLGNANSVFVTPHGEEENENNADAIKSALFICFKRLFTRDNIKNGTFNMFLSNKAPFLLSDSYDDSLDQNTAPASNNKGTQITNLDKLHSIDNNLGNLLEISDLKFGNTNVTVSPVSGEVSTLTSIIDGEEKNVGLIYYDKGIVVLDTEKVFNNEQLLRGKIDSILNDVIEEKSGPWMVSDSDTHYFNMYTTEKGAENADAGGEANSILIDGLNFYQPKTLATAADPDDVVQTNAPYPNNQPIYSFEQDALNDFYSNESVTADQVEAGEGVLLFEGTLKDFMTKASIEEILTHICTVRFGDANESAVTFQNESIINSKIYYCRAAPSQLNMSTNPTYTDEDGNIIAIQGNKPFSFVTSVGLFDSTGTLVAIAKTSRPIEKNSETDLTINVRLDY